jgi:hypothetical protein
MSRLGSHKDEVDRELYVLASILKDLAMSKAEVHHSYWDSKIRDIENVMNHIQNRRFGSPTEGH